MFAPAYASAATCYYEGAFTFDYPGAPYAIDTPGFSFVDTGSPVSSAGDLESRLNSMSSGMFGPGYVTAVPYSGTWTFDQANGTLRSPSFDSAGFAPWASYQLLSPGSVPPIAIVGAYDTGFSTFFAGSYQLPLVCSAAAPAVSSTNVIAAMDDIVGQGVDGIGDLFQGNFGQIIIFFVAVALAGALLGAFWYLKSKVSNSAS